MKAHGARPYVLLVEEARAIFSIDQGLGFMEVFLISGKFLSSFLFLVQLCCLLCKHVHTTDLESDASCLTSRFRLRVRFRVSPKCLVDVDPSTLATDFLIIISIKDHIF